MTMLISGASIMHESGARRRSGQELAAAGKSRIPGGRGGVEAQLGEGGREGGEVPGFKKILENRCDLARGIDVLVAHDSAVVEPALQAILDAGGEPPGEPPE